MPEASHDSLSSEKYPPPKRCLIWFWGVGGAGIRCTQRIGEDLFVHLGSDNIAFSLHAQNAWRSKASEISDNVITVGGAFGYGSGLRILTELFSRFIDLTKQIRDFKPDMIIIPMNFAQAMPLAMIFRIVGYPIVYVAHDAMPHPGDYAQIIQRVTQWALIAIASKIVCFSTYVGENIRNSLPARSKKKLAVLDLCKQSMSAIKEPLRLQDNAPVRFLFLGRLLKYKGLDILLEAIESMKHREDWRLTVAGNGVEQAFVRKHFSAFNQVDLSRLSWLLESEIDELLNTHDVVICPYTEASQSGVLAEAFSVGLPAVVTPVGALPEQVGFGKAGWIAEAATAEELAKAMQYLLNNRHEYTLKSAEALNKVGSRKGEAGWFSVISQID